MVRLGCTACGCTSQRGLPGHKLITAGGLELLQLHPSDRLQGLHRHPAISACADHRIVDDHIGLESLQVRLYGGLQGPLTRTAIFACTDHRIVEDPKGWSRCRCRSSKDCKVYSANQPPSQAWTVALQIITMDIRRCSCTSWKD